MSQRFPGRARLRPSRASRRPRYRNRETIKQRSQLFSFGRFDHVISIEPKRIIAGGMSQGFIPRRREVVDPDIFFDDVKSGDAPSQWRSVATGYLGDIRRADGPEEAEDRRRDA